MFTIAQPLSIGSLCLALLAFSGCTSNSADTPNEGAPEQAQTEAPDEQVIEEAETQETEAQEEELMTATPDYPGEPVTGEPTETPSGLVYYEITVGDGASPASARSNVTVHYTGWLEDGTQFDSSVDRGQPATFPLSRVIAGWTEGVGSMNVGGKRKLIIPGHLAYGATPPPGSPIPQNATLIFDVELLEIVGE